MALAKIAQQLARRGCQLVLVDIEHVTFRNEVQALTWQGWHLLDQDQPTLALDVFSQVLEINPTVGEAHAGLAIASYRLGEKPESTTDQLRKAVFYTPDSYLVQDTLGSIALYSSDVDAAARSFEQMFQILSHPNESREYYASTYSRPSLPFDTVPQFQPIPIPLEQLVHLSWLADYYADQGNTVGAEQVRDWVARQIDG